MAKFYEFTVNSTAFVVAALCCPAEMKVFRNKERYLYKLENNLSNVLTGGWSKLDAEATATAETVGKHLTEAETRSMRVDQLNAEIKTTARQLVRTLVALNKKYFELQGEYLVPYIENRDNVLITEVLEYYEAV